MLILYTFIMYNVDTEREEVNPKRRVPAMDNEFKEYITFVVNTKDGHEVEMAVIDQFEFENKGYVAAALVEGDTVSDEGCFIYRVKVDEDDFKVEKITNQIDYNRVAEAYMDMI